MCPCDAAIKAMKSSEHAAAAGGGAIGGYTAVIAKRVKNRNLGID